MFRRELDKLGALFQVLVDVALGVQLEVDGVESHGASEGGSAQTLLGQGSQHICVGKEKADGGWAGLYPFTWV